MTAAIHLLPSQVADAIAAGEVIERPAAVVKELIENSLDAGAGRVTVEVRGAGRTQIRVVDNGSGIPAGELRLAFQRHATSKVASLEDLGTIASLGFRGEALASVAAVSELECRSGGARIRLRAGEVLDEGSALPVPGTSIEVRDLFANTPARLKFLKSLATETAACLKAIQAYALLYPEVRFEVLVDGRSAMRTPGDASPATAAAAVLGPAVGAELFRVDADGVRGLASPPRLSRGSRDGILLSVNRRPVVSRSLGFAVEECYLGTLERGRYPVVVLDVVVAPAEVDVNVHPAKREVRFRAEGEVFARVQRALRAALAGGAGNRPYELRPTAGALSAAPPSPVLHDTRPEFEAAAPVTVAAPLRPLGQVLDGYLVAEGPSGVVLVDQHAAHERILYNRFLDRLRGAPTASQPLLLPEVVEVEPAQAAAAIDNGERLRALGFLVEEFGPRCVKVLAAPVEMPPGRIEEGVQELLETLAARPGSDSGGLEERVAASVACHSAVRFGDALDLTEQRRLLTELEGTENSVTCPHGRPTRLVLDWQELKRHFRRNY